MADVMGIESPKWTESDGIEYVTVAADLLPCGDYRAQVPYPGGYIFVGGTFDEICRGVGSEMQRMAREQGHKLPHALQMVFVRDRYGKDRIAANLLYGLRSTEKPDHDWNPAWKALAANESR